MLARHTEEWKGLIEETIFWTRARESWEEVEEDIRAELNNYSVKNNVLKYQCNFKIYRNEFIQINLDSFVTKKELLGKYWIDLVVCVILKLK